MANGSNDRELTVVASLDVVQVSGHSGRYLSDVEAGRSPTVKHMPANEPNGNQYQYEDQPTETDVLLADKVVLHVGEVTRNDDYHDAQPITDDCENGRQAQIGYGADRPRTV